MNLEIQKNLHVNNGHFPKNNKGHILKTTTAKCKPQLSATEAVIAAIVQDGDNKWEVMSLSPAEEIHFNEMRI